MVEHKLWRKNPFRIQILSGKGGFGMSSPQTSQSTAPCRVLTVWSNRLGWFAVALAVLVSSFFSMFAFGETAGWGWEGIGHFLQLVPVLGVTVLAIAVPRTGAVLAMLGVLAGVLFRGGTGLVLGLLLVAAGVGFFFGRPRPQRLAYWLAVGVPVVVGVLTLAAVLVFGA